MAERIRRERSPLAKRTEAARSICDVAASIAWTFCRTAVSSVLNRIRQAHTSSGGASKKPVFGPSFSWLTLRDVKDNVGRELDGARDQGVKIEPIALRKADSKPANVMVDLGLDSGG